MQIIYLNGPSSSGKTTLAKKLQSQLDEPCLHLVIDKIIGWMLWKALAGKSLTMLMARPSKSCSVAALIDSNGYERCHVHHMTVDPYPSDRASTITY